MSETIVFFGSGPVAAESLRLLVRHTPVEAVITKPRAAHHHGDVPVLDLAEKLDLPIYTAVDKQSVNNLFTAHQFKSRLAILIDFGIIVSQKVIDFFPKGIINSHFSLLPEWRGADPLTFSILSAQKVTGVSLMLLTAGMDEGPLLAQVPFTLPKTITTPELTEELIVASDQSLQHIIPLWLEDAIVAAPQEAITIATGTEPTYSRKLLKTDGIIDWQKPAEVIEREIRAFAGWPKSRATFKGFEAIIIKAHVIPEHGRPGKTVIINKQPIVYCGDQALVIDIIKPAGKKEMTGEAFLAGYKKVFLS